MVLIKRSKGVLLRRGAGAGAAAASFRIRICWVDSAVLDEAFKMYVKIISMT